MMLAEPVSLREGTILGRYDLKFFAEAYRSVLMILQEFKLKPVHRFYGVIKSSF
jgi:hypothetical protein